uniref:Uncharacterized protein n=1 Tax=Arundo donax TaxID=35708 RepID=A0A0A8Y019_ARUDO
MRTPRKKATVMPIDETEEKVRRSGRLAAKAKEKGNKKTEELAQEVLAKKMGVLEENKKLDIEAKKRYLKMYEGPLPTQAMAVVNDLVKTVKIGKGKGPKKQATA